MIKKDLSNTCYIYTYFNKIKKKIRIIFLDNFPMLKVGIIMQSKYANLIIENRMKKRHNPFIIIDVTALYFSGADRDRIHLNRTKL